jgi:hypothetical protein
VSLKSHEARKLAFASFAALAALGAGASTAQAATLSLDYTCEYPLIGVRALHVDIDATIPQSVKAKTPTPAFDIKVNATASVETWDALQLIGVKGIEGKAAAVANLSLPGGFDYPVNVPITVNPYQVSATRGPLLLTAQGVTPPLTLPTPGTAPINVNSIALNLVARKANGDIMNLPPVNEDSDGIPGTFDVACELDPASQSTLLTTITITPADSTDTPPTAPGTPTPSAITGTTATVSWGASTDDKGVTGYDVYLDGALKTSTAGTVTSANLTGLTAGKTYAVTVKAKDVAGNATSSAAGSLTTTGVTPIDTTPPTKPGTPVASNITATGVKLTWAPSTDDVGVVGYDVYNGTKVVGTSTTPSATIAGLLPSTAYSLTVKARDAKPNTSVASSAVSFTTGVVVVDPPVAYNYNAAGTATLKTLITGSLPLKGTIDASLTVATGAFTADLKLGRSTAGLKALGFLPVAAAVDIVATAPVTGTLKSGVLKANAKVRIKLPKVTLAGIQLAGGSGCQTKQISSINLTSTDAFFYALDGGTLAGQFTISELVNCGFLTGIVSPLTQGSGNAIALKLTPRV